MIGLTRGVSTLAGALVAGILLWFATQVGAETSAEYWATYGLVAAAGLAMALSQILGGWTKWGWPRLSVGVFLLGFLPVLLAGGWVLLARQPADWMNTSNWSRDAGIYGLVQDLGNILPAIAFALGLTFGLVFDTTGPRHEVVGTDVPDNVRYRRARDADEPLTADRREYAHQTVPADDVRHDEHDVRSHDGNRQPVAAGDGRRLDHDDERGAVHRGETRTKRHWWNR
jgi:hypothetical protein